MTMDLSAFGDPRAVFGAKVADYVASRPDYPPALFEALRARGWLAATHLVADLGAGTGLLTRDLLPHVRQVIAVEPNAAMRAASDALLRQDPRYLSVDGRAEATGLPDGVIDLITAAQAFHWFDIDAARRECLRILKPSGQVALIWNDRLLSDPLHQALGPVFETYGGEKRDALLAHEDRSRVAEFFRGQYETLQFDHAHQLDREGLVSLVFSRSYMPAQNSPQGQAARATVAAIFDRHAVEDRVAVRYTTVAMIGRPL